MQKDVQTWLVRLQGQALFLYQSGPCGLNTVLLCKCTFRSNSRNGLILFAGPLPQCTGQVQER